MSHDNARGFVRQVLRTDPKPLGFLGSLGYLIKAVGGSMRAAARKLGVSDSTIRRWRSGTTPKLDRQRLVEGQVRIMSMRPSAMGDAGILISVVSTDRKRGSRDRAIDARQLDIAPGTLDEIKEAWVLTGDPDEAYKAFLRGVQEPWYKERLCPPEWRGEIGIDDEQGYDTEELDSDYTMSVA